MAIIDDALRQSQTDCLCFPFICQLLLILFHDSSILLFQICGFREFLIKMEILFSLFYQLISSNKNLDNF
ncbi:hypothetical protein BpHYR1_011378 [Brachionus plicatilis]|uniref:Uncharacterized protein n=1 Tax=Brachionus plicatilis TaxID=10195 RepID=A0A3M7T4T7_BRAPC|nr:hypothetical protein BpHYR1_011378 [Brachionus plicatilis]